MSCCYAIWSDIIIPLIAALIGGGLTLLGVALTIKSENKKTREEYLEKVRPFFVIEDANDIDTTQVKRIWVNDDSMNDIEPNQIVYHWDSLFISNQSDNVCMVSYIKVNDIEYASLGNEPIKSGNFCEIRGYPLSTFIRNAVDNISIGFFDKNFNLYEYKVSFEIKEYANQDIELKKYCHKAITFSLIDCQTNLAKPKRRAKV